MAALRGSADRWAAYRQWNLAIADVLYGPGADGVPVYLDLEDDVLSEVAAHAGFPGAGRQELTMAVRASLGPPTRQRVFAAHIAQVRAWRAASGQPPPIMALLAVFCLAAEDMRGGQGVSGNNYYDRLMPLLGVPPDSKARVVGAYRDSSGILWGTLNSWLEDLQGVRGLPTAYSWSHEHVGAPISQALIRGVERDKLKGLFDELDLPPRTQLSQPDMTAILTEWISRRPSPATNALQAMWRSDAARGRVVEMACQLLAAWEPARTSPPSRTDRHRASEVRSRQGAAGLVAQLGSFPLPYLQLGLIGAGTAPGDLQLSARGGLRSR